MTDAPLREFETLDVRLVERWLASRPPGVGLSTASAGPARRERQTYLDTAGRQVLRSGRALRLVRRAGHFDAELVDARTGAVAFAETDLSARPADVRHAPGAVGERVRALVGRSALREVATFEVRTSVHEIHDGDARAGQFVLQVAAIPLEAGRRRVRIERIGVAPAGEPMRDRVDAFVAEMRTALGLTEARSGLVEAALAASGVTPPRRRSFGPSDVAPTLTLGAVAFAVLRRQFTAFLDKEPGTRLGDDPEELHDMRVASRRLRAAMRLFRDALPKPAVALREEIAWIAAALGEVRDLDVQKERYDAWAAADPRLAVAVAPLERAEARRRMLEVLDSARYRRFVREFGALLRKGPPRRNAAASAPVVAAAPDLVRTRRKRLRRAAKRLTPTSPPDAYHEVRIAGKRLRYALEFLDEVYGEPAHDLAERLAEVQDLLGGHQDACVAIDRLETALTRTPDLRPATAFAMGLAAERNAQDAARLRRRFPRAFERTTGKPWRRLRETMESMAPSPRPPAIAPSPAPIPGPDDASSAVVAAPDDVAAVPVERD